MKKFVLTLFIAIGSILSVTSQNNVDHVEYNFKLQADSGTKILDFKGQDNYAPNCCEIGFINQKGDLEFSNQSQASGSFPVFWTKRYIDRDGNVVGSMSGSFTFIYDSSTTMDDIADAILDFYYAL